MSGLGVDKGQGRDELREIRKEASRIHESVLLSAEAQFANCKIWRWGDRLFGTTAAALAAIAGVTGLANVVSAGVAGLIAILAAGLGAVAASIGPAKIAERASTTANSYRNLQQDARIFMNIDLGSLELEEAREHLQVLVERQQELNNAAPVPSALAWRMGKKNGEQGGQDYEADGGTA